MTRMGMFHVWKFVLLAAAAAFVGNSCRLVAFVCRSIINTPTTRNQRFVAFNRRSLGADQSSGNLTAQLQLPLNERFGMAYTCGVCGFRNAVLINRIAWKQGVVLATCQGCKANHLLADEGGLLDLGNTSHFTNVLELAQARGEAVKIVDPSNEEELQKFGWMLDEAGQLKSAKAKRSAETLPERDSLLPPNSVKRCQSADSPASKDLRCEAPVVEVPTNARAGEVLRVSTEIGSILVPIPSDAAPGYQLQVQGVVEVVLPDLPSGEESIIVNLPNGVGVSIPISDGMVAGTLLSIAYPIEIIEPT